MSAPLPTIRRLPALARFAVLVAAVWAPAHDLVYLAAYGPTRAHHALEASGHGTYWFAIGFAALLGIAALTVLVAQRSIALQRRLRALGGVVIQRLDATRLAGRIVRLWLLVLAVSLAIFIGQENLEHFTQHAGHVPALGVLYAGEYGATVPVFAGLALAAAAMGSLAIERLRALAEAVARAEGIRRPARVLLRPAWLSVRRPRLLQATPDLGRAPPLDLAA